MNRATLKDAPAVLNTNDKAMWVLGFNEAVDRQSERVKELEEALKKCAAVCAGHTTNKNGLIDALEAACAALEKKA